MTDPNLESGVGDHQLSARTRQSVLPDFGDPPVSEVLLDAGLDPLPLVRAANLSLFWAERLRDEYPVYEEQPPIALREELFAPEPSVIKIRFNEPAALMRQWFISADGARLVQLQLDRFIENWRRGFPGGAYPRFENIRASFEHDFQIYSDFLVTNDLGSPNIRQTEVTYINHLQPDQVWKSQSDVGLILRSWKPDVGEEDLLMDPIEEVRLAWRHVIADDAGPYARLYVSVEPVIGGGLVLQLTVRGKPRDGTLKTAMDFFDMDHERIVKAFTAITTDAMHRRWKRRI